MSASTGGLGVPEEINISELLKPYVRKWWWFVLGIVTAIALFFLYIKITPPIYEMRSTVLIRDVKKSALDFGMMSDLSSFGGRSSSTINNEMELLKSRKLLKDVVERLGIQNKVYAEDFFRKNELYGEFSPFLVRVITEKEIDPEFKIKSVYVKMNGDRLELSGENLKVPIITAFNKTISLPYANLMITRNKDFNAAKAKKLKNFSFVYSSLDKTVIELQKLTDISLVDRNATVIGININYPNIEKGKAIVNSLVSVYNDDATNDKNSESNKTKEFIDERLAIITNDLGRVEDEKEQFKTANKITDISAEAQLNLGASASARTKILDIDTQLTINNDLINYLSKQGNNQVLPSAIGLNNPTASANITAYNGMVMERNKLLENATPQNPAVVELTKEIANMRVAVMETLIKNGVSLQEVKNQMTSEQNTLQSKIGKVPVWEKMFRNIERQQALKENLYMVLLQKREETAITLANTTPKAKIVDYAFPSLKPVSPKKLVLFIAAIAFGGLIPLLLIYLKELLNNKVRSKHDLERLSKVSVIGEIPSLNKGDSEVIVKNDLSPMAEAFRILITNLNFMLQKKNTGKFIFVTSSVKGEGKTFISVNMALTLATPKVKVLVIGADIRNPQLQRYSPDKKGVQGLTEFLYDETMTAKELIHESMFNPNCDLLYSGSIPPNPTELLTNGRMKELINEVQHLYDYVILDTAPLMLVTDSFLFADMADATVYVTRSGYTEKSLIEFANSVIYHKKVRNVGFVINDVKKEFYSYGNKYGYGYNSQETKKWWQFYK